ncbi:3-oxoacyl-reductase [Microthyrium microscopicum]|uniref:3-oxoacyl-reductase n=1 Tax=Microthyrium microscopicum TaxID=703497 RepID=A0A6A6UR40_9PEZI|nr:3-oxoacyl-reductase [Microthyrium microscopicum]
MINLQDKVVAVTGGASGIGLATVKLLVSLGAKVSIGDVSQAGLDAAKADLEQANAGTTNVFTKAVDVRSRESVDAWIAATVEWGGALDGAVNLAGVVGKYEDRTMKDFDEDDFDFVMSVNLKGVLHCLRAEMNAMNGKTGSIVNAASISSLIGVGSDAAYVASKHGVLGLTRAAARECGSGGVRVNAIAPGIVDTPMLRKSFETRGEISTSHTALNRKGEPEEIANLIAFLVSDASSFITGACYSIDGGWNC